MARSAKKHTETQPVAAPQEVQPPQPDPQPTEPAPSTESSQPVETTPQPAAETKSIGQQLDDAVGRFAMRREESVKALTDLKSQLANIQSQIAGHEQTLANLDRDQAHTVKNILNQNAIRLEPVLPSAGKTNRRKLGKAEMAAAMDGVANALSTSSHKSRSVLAQETGLDMRTVARALSKLHRAGRAESNGVRGANGGWIRK